MEVKDIQGNILIDALVTEQAVKTEELMRQHSITLSWVSVTNDELPLGAYIEHEGVRYSLLAPYKPEQSDEATFAYKPVFEHPVMRWKYIPFFFYTYSEGKVISKELDWSLTDNPANFMKAVCDAILNETGEDWSYEISADLPASASQSFSNTDIFSALNAIASAFETEWWFDYANKIAYLSKASYGDAVTLEVGQNIGVPSKNQGRDGYYTRFYAFGSTRNIEQNYAGSNVNSIVNKRLTLDPVKYPNGYIDIREGLTESEILVKPLVFDDIYPRSSLTIADVKVRLMWRLDNDNQKVQIGTDGDGNPVYDQYAIWYFKVPGLSFDKEQIIAGKALSVHFNSGALNGREFELTYHDKEKTVDTSDGTSVIIEPGEFEINFIEEGTFIIPAISGLIPSDGDEITLFNIKMPEEYKTSAYNDLEEAVLKEIAKQDVDNRNYTFNSNKRAFYESNPYLTVGRKVLFKNGNTELETRVIRLETQLDYAFEQRITIGNEQIKRTTQTLKEEVVNANQNIDLISAINESTQQLQQSYQRTQKALQESMAQWGDMWQLDKENDIIKTRFNLYSEKEIIASRTADGIPEGGGGGGSYDLLESWEFYDENKREALGANLGYELKQDLEEGLNQIAWDEYKDGEGGGGSSEPNEGVVSETKLVKYITDYVEYLGLKYIEDGDYLKATKPIVSEEEIISCSRADKTDSDANGGGSEGITEITADMIINALGYTPYNASNPQGYVNASDIPSLDGYATQTWVSQQGFLTQHQDLSAYAKKTDIPSLNGYATQSWVENKKYLTSVPSEYVTETELIAKGYATASDVQVISTHLSSLEGRFESHLQAYGAFVEQQQTVANGFNDRLNELEAFELSLETEDDVTYLRSKYAFVSNDEVIATKRQ